jgi:glycine/D-amino acid oxidase-like deaminating enzyme
LPLRHDAAADVCVIGAGISGLTVAYELTVRGASVVVLDQGAIGLGETANTTAHLVTALDERYFEIERIHGPRAAAIARESHAAAIDRIESIVRSESIACDFRRLDGYIFVPRRQPNADALLRRELDAATRAGAVAETLAFIPGCAVQSPCLRFSRQAQLQPLLYLDALAARVRQRRGLIFTGSRAASIDTNGSCVVHTSDHFRVHCGAVIVAANSSLNPPAPGVPLQTPFRSFVVALQLPPDALTAALYWDGYWDEDTPYHYVRLARSARSDEEALLVVGGEDQELTSDSPVVSQSDFAARIERLRTWAGDHFPLAGELVNCWHGRILEPIDEFAYIGRRTESERNVYVVSGDSGNGMTYAAIAGMMLPELIAGREHPWQSIYSPQRPRLETPARRALCRGAPT